MSQDGSDLVVRNSVDTVIRNSILALIPSQRKEACRSQTEDTEIKFGTSITILPNRNGQLRSVDAPELFKVAVRDASTAKIEYNDSKQPDNLSTTHDFHSLASHPSYNEGFNPFHARGAVTSPTNYQNYSQCDRRMIDDENDQGFRKLQNSAGKSSVHRSKQARYPPAKWLQRRSASRQHHPPSQLENLNAAKYRHRTPRRKIRLPLPHELPLVPSRALLFFHVA